MVGDLKKLLNLKKGVHENQPAPPARVDAQPPAPSQSPKPDNSAQIQELELELVNTRARLEYLWLLVGQSSTKYYAYLHEYSAMSEGYRKLENDLANLKGQT
jgi:hypothetical protein